MGPQGGMVMGSAPAKAWASAHRRVPCPHPGQVWASLAPKAERLAWRGPDGVWWLGEGALHLTQVEAGEAEAWAALAEAQAQLAQWSEVAGLPWRAWVALAFDPERPGPLAPAARVLVPQRLARWEEGEAQLWVMMPRTPLASAAAQAEGEAARWAEGVLHARPPAGPTGGRWASQPQEALHWRQGFDAAQRAFQEGRFRKLVLSREAKLHLPPHPDPFGVVMAIAPHGRHVALLPTGRPRAWWLMASPERLVEVSGREVGADALAGTAPRGATPGEDLHLAQALAEDPKELAEHAWVVRGLQEALAPWCSQLDLPTAPSLRRLPQVQHLFTPCRGTLHPGASALDAARALHPTPAVGGWPREEVRSWLAAHEGPRGWYGGAVGWLEAEALELAVGLRGGHLGPGGLVARAGGGLVEASQPEREWQETESKLRIWHSLVGGGDA